MKTSKQIQVLKSVKQIVGSLSEYTPPQVKSSEKNVLVAKAMLSIDDFINYLKTNHEAKNS